MVAIDDVYASDALQMLLNEQLRLDAHSVCQEMNAPSVDRVRAEVSEPGTFRLLALRTARMASATALLRERMIAVCEHKLSFERPRDVATLKREITSSLETCLRVLESTDNSTSINLVTDNANTLVHCIGTMSTVLADRAPELSAWLAETSLRATTIAQNGSAIASEMKKAYEKVRAEIAKTGPRMVTSASQENPAGAEHYTTQ